MHRNQTFDSSINNIDSDDELDDMYEDDVIQGDEAVLQSPHETEGVQDGAGEQPDTTHDSTTSSQPSRLQRQQPSWQGRVAYVIYGGQDSEAGVYYNWASCSAVIRRYHRNGAPPYLGFNAEDEARFSFAAFQAAGQLPRGLFPPVSLQPLGSQSSVPSSQTPPPLYLPRGSRGMTPTPPRPAVNPLLLRTPHTPVRAAPQAQSGRTPQTSICPPSEMRANADSVPTLLSPTQRNIGPASVVLFYLVIEGDAPSVYGSQGAAIRARGLLGPRINAYTTRDTANQAFVDAYMASRVSAYLAPAL